MSQPPQRVRGRPRDDHLTARRREEILVVATRLFAAHGYANLDLQLVADELGVGKGTIYRYFPSKKELFLAAVDSGMRQLVEQIDRIVAEVPDLLERMQAVIHTYLEFFDRHPELVELFVQERAEFRDRETPTYFIYRDRNIQRHHDDLNELMAAGRLRQMPVERISQVIGDLLYGTMFTNYFARRHASPAQQAADIIDITLRGLLTEQEQEHSYE